VNPFHSILFFSFSSLFLFRGANKRSVFSPKQSLGIVISDTIRQNLKIVREEIVEENAGITSQLYNWWYSTPTVEQQFDITPKL